MKCASFAIGVCSIRTAAVRRSTILVHCSWMTNTVCMRTSIASRAVWQRNAVWLITDRSFLLDELPHAVALPAQLDTPPQRFKRMKSVFHLQVSMVYAYVQYGAMLERKTDTHAQAAR